MSNRKGEARLLFIVGHICIIFLCTTVIFSCAGKDEVAEEVSKIDLELEVIRFDEMFSSATPKDLPVLQQEYPYLFPENYPDSVWVAKLRDTIQQEVLNEVKTSFPGFGKERQDLELFFKYVKYYFPRYTVPKVITLTSDVDYNSRVIFADSLVLIGLDNYLGQEHKFYRGIPNYIAFGLDRKFLVSDVAGEWTKRMVPKPQNRSFLARAIYFGKQLYLKDKAIPFIPEAVRIGYSEDQLNWAKANEEPMWRYFIERELLYSTDAKLSQRFLEIAPFSKFGLELDNESPGRIGRFLGWRIVRAFMEKNDISVQALLQLPEDDIFKRSNYKPKK